MMTPIRVCMLCTEVSPFSRAGDLADDVAGLARGLSQIGLEVLLISPLYPSVRASRIRKVSTLPAIRTGDSEVVPELFEAEGGNGSLRHCFIGADGFFDRGSVYRDPETGSDWSDNFERFHFFGLAALEALARLAWKPQILQCHESQTALVPAYLKLLRMGEPFFAGISTVLTIHNIGYQGTYSAEKFQLSGLPPELFYAMGPFEYYGRLNCLKAGICYADAVSTVSSQYAREIQTKEHGRGLDEVLKRRGNRLVGVLNGIDCEEWDPTRDPLLETTYSIDHLEAKVGNKSKLQDLCGLAPRQVPLIGWPAGLDTQTGLPQFSAALPELLRIDCQWVVFGNGNLEAGEVIRNLAVANPEKLFYLERPDRTWHHMLQAGADMILLAPSEEPCGFHQMRALRYGTLPVVRYCGGLAESVANFDPKSGQGYGFRFFGTETQELVRAITRAVETWQEEPAQWQLAQRNGMSVDFSWARTAKAYLEIYEHAANHS